MKLTLKNIGKVSEADINLPGVTVVAGPNGTGKSTISRALMVLKNLNRNLSMLVAYERVTSIIAGFKSAVSEARMQLVHVEDPAYDDLGAWGEALQKDFWRKSEAFSKWIIRYFMPYAQNEKAKDGLGILVVEGDDPKEKIGGLFRILAPRAMEILQKDVVEYERHVCTKALNTAFAEQWVPCGRVTSEGRIVLKNDSVVCGLEYLDGEVCRSTLPGSRDAESWIYLEPYHMLDFVNDYTLSRIGDRYVADGFCTLRLLGRKVPTENTLEQESALRKARQLLARISKILGGHVHDNSEGKISFLEQRNDGSVFDVSLLNIASGMKTLSSIYRAIENGSFREKGLLIIDEPESNLHPEWQIAFAKVIVAIRQEMNAQILVTTHSPYFMRALEVYMKLAGCQDQFEAYLMNPVAGNAGYGGMVADRVTDSVEDIYRQMYRPLEQIKMGNESEKAD